MMPSLLVGKPLARSTTVEGANFPTKFTVIARSLSAVYWTSLVMVGEDTKWLDDAEHASVSFQRNGPASRRMACSIVGCIRYAKRSGLCLCHFRSLSQECKNIPGKVEAKEEEAVVGNDRQDIGSTRMKFCTVDGCKNKAKSRGFCKRHGGATRCAHLSCGRCARRGGFCIRHGGDPCVIPGCTSGARMNRTCRRHGNIRFRNSSGRIDAKKDESSGEVTPRLDDRDAVTWYQLRSCPFYSAIEE